MAKGKVTINITKTDYVYIDGETGEELTKAEFNRRHNKGIKSILGANRIEVQGKGGTEEEGSN